MKTNQSKLWISSVALSMTLLPSLVFGAVPQQYGCSQTKTDSLSQTLNAKEAEVKSEANPTVVQTDLNRSAPIDQKLRQARQNHHVTTGNVDCDFDSLAD